jgi:hypothetical protein
MGAFEMDIGVIERTLILPNNPGAWVTAGDMLKKSGKFHRPHRAKSPVAVNVK